MQSDFVRKERSLTGNLSRIVALLQGIYNKILFKVLVIQTLYSHTGLNPSIYPAKMYIHCL